MSESLYYEFKDFLEKLQKTAPSVQKAIADLEVIIGTATARQTELRCLDDEDYTKYDEPEEND